MHHAKAIELNIAIVNKDTKGLNNFIKYEFPESSKDLKVSEKIIQYLLFEYKIDVPFPKITNPKFTFIDLFAGIGGMRLAYQNLDGECVFTSEWDKFSQKLMKLILVKNQKVTLLKYMKRNS